MTVDGNEAFEVLKGLAKGLREAYIMATTWLGLTQVYYIEEVSKKYNEAETARQSTQQLYKAFKDCCTLQPDEINTIKAIFNEPCDYIVTDVLKEYARIIEGL